MYCMSGIGYKLSVPEGLWKSLFDSNLISGKAENLAQKHILLHQPYLYLGLGKDRQANIP